MGFNIIHHVDQPTIDLMYNGYAPVFVLSTGRSGTKLAAALLNACSNVSAFHEPRPALQYFTGDSFRNRGDLDMLTRIFNAARMEMILETYIQDKIYVESNQCLTFYAPAIAGLFRNAKFIHIIRHPGDFVRSAIQKGWYMNDSIWESGRIKPLEETNGGGMAQTEKLAWLWLTVNTFIDEFKTTLAPRRVMTIKMEELTGDVQRAFELAAFVGGAAVSEVVFRDILGNKINAFTISPNEPPNIRKIPGFPNYSSWEEGQKNKVRRFAGDKAADYGYHL